MNAEDIIKYLISTVGISGVIIFIARTIFVKSFDFARDKYKAELDRDLEQYKNTLALEAENYKAGLNLANAEQGIRFSKLHEKRAELIENMHELLMGFQIALKKLTSLTQDGHSHSTNQVEARNSMIAFVDYYNKSRIYLPISTCLLIQELKEKGLDVINNFFKIQVQMGEPDGKDLPDSAQREIISKWLTANGVVNGQINKVRVSLENTFRVLLGDPVTEGAGQITGQLEWNEMP